MRKGSKCGVTGAACVGVLSAAGYGAYSFLAEPSGHPGPTGRTVVAQPPSAEAAESGEKAFLTPGLRVT